MAFTKYQDRLADALTILRDDLIPWAQADFEASQDAEADAQAATDLMRVKKLRQAEMLLEEAWK